MKKNSYSLEDEIINGQKKSIKDWRSDERPRERLATNGAKSLTDAELLAIIIRSGSANNSALDIARNMLEKHGSLTHLATCDFSEFKHFKGLGSAKAVTLAAVFEISKRVEAEPFSERTIIRSPEDVANFFISRLKTERREVFIVVMLNSSNQIIRYVNISEGSLNASVVHPREVFRLAIAETAASIILIHNHPSGNPEPSKEDISITRQLVETGKVIDIKVMDHLIIAGENYTSFTKRGLI